jgi:hypothetical protein
MAKFYDISQWQEKPHFQTGGTRNKCIVEYPDNGNLYYFKTSLYRENGDYKYEFWSEIIASEIGKELGFNTLPYHIAFNGKEIGCISESMINTNKNKLSEIINYLRGYDSNYKPNDKNSYSKYTFHFIEKALKDCRLKDKMNHIVTTIIFDSLIGNGDRHQENWGFIVPNTNLNEKIKDKTVDTTFFKSLMKIFHQNLPKYYLEDSKGIFAPIYDSGSCLGRELSDEKVEKMLEDRKMLEAYINRDRSEIRWEGAKNKISHFDLIQKIKNESSSYKDIVVNEIERVVKKFKIENIGKLIDNVDKQLPEELKQYKLPDTRKELMKKFVSLRFDRLKGF